MIIRKYQINKCYVEKHATSNTQNPVRCATIGRYTSTSIKTNIARNRG